MNRSCRFEWDDYERTYLGLVQKPPSVRPPDVPRGWKYSVPWWPEDSAGSGCWKLLHSSHFFWRKFRIPPVLVHIEDAVDSNLGLSVSFFELSSSAASLHLETAFGTSLSSRPTGRSRMGRGGSRATCPGCWEPPCTSGLGCTRSVFVLVTTVCLVSDEMSSTLAARDENTASSKMRQLVNNNM